VLQGCHADSAVSAHAVQAEYAAALQRYKAATFVDQLSTACCLPVLCVTIPWLFGCPQAEYAAALQRYKAATFVDQLSDEELAAAQKGYDSGMAQFKRGALQEALVIFDEVGGVAALRLCLTLFTEGLRQQHGAVQARRPAGSISHL
jgi:hypothetical protein